MKTHTYDNLNLYAGFLDVSYAAGLNKTDIAPEIIEGQTPIWNGSGWDQLDNNLANDRRMEPVRSEKIEELWESCNAYCDSRLNANGFTTLSLGRASSAKAAACLDWHAGIWTSYYARRDAICIDQEVDFDFSDMGEMPYSFREAYEEILVSQ